MVFGDKEVETMEQGSATLNFKVEEEEKRERWGRLPDNVVEKLQSAGLEKIPEDWGSLSDSVRGRLEGLGFKGILELCGMSTLELEEILETHDSRAVKICDQIDAAIKSRITRLGLQVGDPREGGVPALTWPTRDAWREGNVFVSNRGEEEAMAEQTTETAVAEDEKEVSSVGAEELEPGDEHFRWLVKQLLSQGVKPVSAENLARAFPNARSLRDIYQIAKEQGKEVITTALKSGPADGAVDDLFEAGWGERPLGTSRDAGHRSRGERPVARLARLTGFSDKTRIVQVLASISGVADAQTAEEIVAFAQTEKGQAELKGDLRGVSLHRFDDWCERGGSGRPLGTPKVPIRGVSTRQALPKPRSKAVEEGPLAFLAGEFSNRMRERLAAVPELAEAKNREEVLAFAGTKEGTVALTGAIRGGHGRVRFDDFCEKHGQATVFGTKGREAVVPAEELKKKAAGAVAEAAKEAELPIAPGLAEAIAQLPDSIANLARTIDNFSIRTMEEAKLLGVCQRLTSIVGFEEGFSQIKGMVDVLLQAAKARRKE